MSIGVIYIARGKEFIKEAHTSAASLKKHMPGMSITLFCDREVRSSYFEDVLPVKTPRFTLKDKILHIGLSPYDYTLFLDTDTYICDSISELFTLLGKFDIAVAHAPYRALYQPDGIPDSFPEFNTGVILFRKSSRIMEFFSMWLTLYERHLQRLSRKEIRWLHPREEALFHGDLPCQATFREALYDSDLRIATLTSEYNCRLTHPGFVHNPVKILHRRGTDLQTIAKAINANTRPRVYMMSRGTLKVFSHPELSKRVIDQAKWSIQIRGIWGTVVLASRKFFNKLEL